jgi:hypothetical protein
MTDQRPVGKESGNRAFLLLTRGNAVFLFVVASGWLLGFEDRQRRVWSVGVAAFVAASALFFWNSVGIMEPDGTKRRRVVVIAYLLALLVLLASIVANQKVVPSIVFGSASLGMALLIAKLPSLISRTPVA